MSLSSASAPFHRAGPSPGLFSGAGPTSRSEAVAAGPAQAPEAGHRGGESAVTGRSAGDAESFEARLRRAVRRVTGVEVREIDPGRSEPRDEGEARRRAAHFCDVHGIRSRSVSLRYGWWRRDAGPLLAFHRGTEPVALVPKAGGRYLCELADGRTVVVDAELAAELGPKAVSLVPPLPARRVTFLDLVKVGLRGLGTDVWTVFLLSLACGVLALATPLATEFMVDSVLRGSERSGLWALPAAMAVAAVAAALLQLARGLALVRLKSRLDQSLQASLWNRLLSLPASFFRRFTTGDLSARSMGVQRIYELLTGDITTAVLAALSALVSLGILFMYSGLLAILAVILVAVQGLVAVWVAKLQLDRQRRAQEVDGRLNGLLHALLAGLSKLRSGGAERRGFERWARVFAHRRELEVGVQRTTNAHLVWSEVYGPTMTLVLFAGMTLALGGGLSVGGLLAVHAAFGQFQVAALGAMAVMPTLIGFVPTWERLQPILQTLPESRAGLEDPGVLSGAMELRDVDFRYHEDGPRVLDGVSLRVDPGEMVALVGPSGSGKSTCLRLLLGFEQPERGRVLFDGKDLSTLEPNLLRRQLGVVLQNGRPIVGTVFQNIVGAQQASVEEAWWAAEQAGLADDIHAMPMGMFTLVNQRGVSFSGGQCQRLLLARAILSRPRIFLLDEATSALDNRTQNQVVRNLEALDAGRLVVAHRLSTIQRADRIFVLDGGRVVEQGTYEALRRRNGLFERLAARQSL